MTRLMMALAIVFLIVAAPSWAADTDPKKEPETYLKVEAKGKLRTGIMAIGGETTGSMITTPGGTYEVELPAKADADKLNGKTVIITGTMYQKKGVTRPGVRTIIKVEKLTEVK